MATDSWIILGVGVIGLALLSWIVTSVVKESRRAIRATVSGGLLHFTRLDGTAGSIAVDQVVEVVDISNEGRGQAFEIVLRDGGRLILNVRPVGVGGFRVFVERLQRANPKIRSAVRENE